MINILSYNFFQNALIGSLFASIIAGIIGTIIVEKKLVMLSSGIAHISFGGVGLGFFLQINPIWGAYLLSGLASIGIVKINNTEKSYPDTIIGMFWAFAMALGILFIYLAPSYPPDVNSYLFGDILTISKTNIYLIIATTVATLAIFIAFYNHWIAYLFDSNYFKILNINKKIFDYLLFLLITVTIIALIKLVGIILVIALLTIPPSLAKLFSNSFKKIIFLSSIFSFMFMVLGLFLSYHLNIPSGATIIITGFISYIFTFIIKR